MHELTLDAYLMEEVHAQQLEQELTNNTATDPLEDIYVGDPSEPVPLVIVADIVTVLPEKGRSLIRRNRKVKE